MQGVATGNDTGQHRCRGEEDVRWNEGKCADGKISGILSPNHFSMPNILLLSGGWGQFSTGYQHFSSLLCWIDCSGWGIFEACRFVLIPSNNIPAMFTFTCEVHLKALLDLYGSLVQTYRGLINIQEEAQSIQMWATSSQKFPLTILTSNFFASQSWKVRKIRLSSSNRNVTKRHFRQTVSLDCCYDARKD